MKFLAPVCQVQPAPEAYAITRLKEVTLVICGTRVAAEFSSSFARHLRLCVIATSDRWRCFDQVETPIFLAIRPPRCSTSLFYRPGKSFHRRSFFHRAFPFNRYSAPIPSRNETVLDLQICRGQTAPIFRSRPSATIYNEYA